MATVFERGHPTGNEQDGTMLIGRGLSGSQGAACESAGLAASHLCDLRSRSTSVSSKHT